MGHVNTMASNMGELMRKVDLILDLIYGGDVSKYVPPWYAVTS